jgi:hypothetical protein
VTNTNEGQRPTRGVLHGNQEILLFQQGLDEPLQLTGELNDQTTYYP